jgi:HK97 family phage major capsid protein
MFVEKSLEEISKMTLEEQTAYQQAKKSHEAEQLKAQIEEATKNSASKEDIEALTKKNADVIKEIERLGLELKKLNETPKGAEKGFKSVGEAIKHALDGVKDEIAKAVAGKQDSAIKVAVTMQVDNTIGAGDTQVSITDNTNIISPIRKRELRYLANVSVGRTSGNRAMWIEELDEQGTPIMLGEGDTKTQLSVRYEEQTAVVKKIAVYGKVTTEMMADLPQLISYIQNNLMKRMDIVVENQLFNGDGLTDNLKGAFTLATAFAAGTLANTITLPNDYDVVQAVALQTELAFGVPNAIFVNPAIVARMKMTKDQDGQYVMPTFATANGLEVSGMRVIPTTAVTGENFIGGDLSVLQVLIREELGIQIGLNGNDFIENKKTMLIEKRLVQFASANDVACLVKGAFNTAKALLATT